MSDTTTTAEMTDLPAMPELGASTAGVVSRRRWRSPLSGLSRTSGGIGAVGVKELRGRMRGRRAFIILTIYLLLLGGFAWMVELIMERTVLVRLRRQRDLRHRGHRPGDLRRAADARDPPGRLPGARLDGRRDQHGAREADARAPRRDADHVARDRARQAAQRAGLRLAPDRRIDPADRRGLRLRRRRAGGRPAWVPRPGRDGARAWVPSGCSAPAWSSGPRPRRRSRSSASWR